MNASRKPLFGFGLVVGAAFLWAVIPISLKKIGNTFDAYTITWLRFAVSAVLLFVFAYTQGEIKRLQKRDVWLMVLAGGGIGFNYVLYTLGIKFTTASAGNVVVNLEAVWLVILGRLWLKERIGGLKLAGTLITFAGVFAAIWTGDGFCALIKSKYFLGNMLIAACAPFWAIYGVGQKLLVERDVPVTATLAGIFAVAAVFVSPMVVAGYHINPPISTSVWIWMFVLIVPATLGSYLLMGKSLEFLDASSVAVASCILPVITILAARIFLDEMITSTVVMGALLVAVGMIITGRAEVDAAQS